MISGHVGKSERSPKASRNRGFGSLDSRSGASSPSEQFLERPNDLKTAIAMKGKEMICFAGLWGVGRTHAPPPEHLLRNSPEESTTIVCSRWSRDPIQLPLMKRCASTFNMA